MGKMLLDRFEVSIEHEMDRSYLVLKLIKPDSVIIYNYQIEMIANNPKSAIIPFEIRRKDEEIFFYYNITSKITLSDYIRNRKLSKYAFVSILYSIINNILDGWDIFLNEKDFVMDEELIYIEPGCGTLCMIYVPVDVNLDQYRELKDLIIRLITRTPLTGIQAGDDCLQRIIEFLKANEFNIKDFHRLLAGIETGDVVPMQESCCKKTGRYDLQFVFTCGFSQAFVIALAAAVDMFMKAQKVASDTRYIFIGILVTVIDLIIFKRIILSRNNNAGNTKSVKKQSVKKQSVKKQSAAGEAAPVYRNVTEETALLCESKTAYAFLTCDRNGISEEFAINKVKYIIGRNPDISDMFIDDKTIGRVHAEIISKGDGYFITDKNSRNGTYVNEARLEEGKEYNLASGDSIVFANIECRFIINYLIQRGHSLYPRKC